TAWAMVPAPITAMFKVFGIGRLLGLGGSGGSSAGSRRAPCRLRHRAPDQRGAHARFYHTEPLPSRAVPLATCTARSPPVWSHRSRGGRRPAHRLAGIIVGRASARLRRIRGQTLLLRRPQHLAPPRRAPVEPTGHRPREHPPRG